MAANTLRDRLTWTPAALPLLERFRASLAICVNYIFFCRAETGARCQTGDLTGSHSVRAKIQRRKALFSMISIHSTCMKGIFLLVVKATVMCVATKLSIFAVLGVHVITSWVNENTRRAAQPPHNCNNGVPCTATPTIMLKTKLS
jgi:hypothetical protein